MNLKLVRNGATSNFTCTETTANKKGQQTSLESIKFDAWEIRRLTRA